MLTKRQEVYWLTLFSLLGQGSASYEERRSLFLARNSIDSGGNFGNTMRQLIIDLEEVKKGQKGKLTPNVEKLLSEIKVDYGY